MEILLGSLIGGLLTGGANYLISQGQAEEQKKAEGRAVGRSMAEKGLQAGMTGIESSRNLSNSAFDQLMSSYRGLME